MTSSSIPKVMRAVRVHKFGGIGALQIDKVRKVKSIPTLTLRSYK